MDQVSEEIAADMESLARVRTLRRVAFIVSHPVQYYAPLYRRLVARGDLDVRVFFTWHDGSVPVMDRGFGAAIQWDIPVREGYDSELVPNRSPRPGTQSFWGLVNPELVSRVLAWQPDAVHVTGYAWWSHLVAMRRLSRAGIPILFRGDSHLLDGATAGISWRLKKAMLQRIFAWPSLFLYVGNANRAYYEAFGVPASRLAYCPHSVDVARFAAGADESERRAAAWRNELGIADDRVVLLFAGKFERKKRPVDLMQALRGHPDPRLALVMVGDGELGDEVRAIAAADPGRFRVLPFQNQSRMPDVYRLGDLFVLPSAWGETWGLATNEALACGRPVLVSDRVGCAADVIDASVGAMFPADDWMMFRTVLGGMLARQDFRSLRQSAAARAWQFDISATERTLVESLGRVGVPVSGS